MLPAVARASPAPMREPRRSRSSAAGGSPMRDGMRRSMVRQLMANGGDQAMVESMEAEIDEMTRQLEAKMQKISKRKSGGGAGRRSGARSTDPASGTATAVDGARNTRPERPGSLPQMTKGNGKRSTASGAPRIKGVKVSAASSTEKMARRAQQKAKEAANQPAAKMPPKRPARTITNVQPPQDYETEDALILRNIREQWKQIQYAIRAIDLHSHLDDPGVAQFGQPTSLLPPRDIRKVLARFAIVFSDGYWNFLVRLLQPEQNGEVNYQSFLSIFAKGNRHEDRNAIKPVSGISIPKAKQMVQEMIESKITSGPGGLRRCFQFFDMDGSGSIDHAEFKHVLHLKANLAFDDKILKALMKEYDDDGTGTIDFRKFVENVLGSRSGQADCISKVRPKGISNVVSSDAGTSEHMLRRKIQMAKKELRAAFRDRDNGRGSISVPEFRAVLEKFDVRMTDSQFKKLIKMMDEDGDGEITYSEFIAYFKKDIDASNVLKPIKDISVQQAKQMIKENIENKLPSGPAPLRRCWKYFDVDSSGSIDYEEFKSTLLMKANLSFDEQLLRAVMRDYDDDGSGIIDYRKFCENVLMSHPDDAGGWGSSSSGSNARFPGRKNKSSQRGPTMQSLPEGGRTAVAAGGDTANNFGLTATSIALNNVKNSVGTGQEQAWRPDGSDWKKQDVRKRQAATRY